MNRKPASPLLWLTAIAAGCSGTIDGEPPPADPTSQSPAGSQAPGRAAGGGTAGANAGPTPGPAGGGTNPINATTPPVDPATCKAMPTLIAPSYMRRLTNTEYRRTLRDLLGTVADKEEAADLPGDSAVAGFENNAAAQSLSAKHLGAYLTVSERMTAALLVDTRARDTFFGCQPTGAQRASCTRAFVERLGRRAYRRPLTPAESTDFAALATKFATDADPFAGVEAVTQAMLTSTNFIFLVETGTADAARPGYSRLTGYEVASRLSYLLTGTMPDEELLKAAGAGTLDASAGIISSARMLLAGPRAVEARRNFFSSWLGMKGLSQVVRDPQKYPAWNDTLAAAMSEETTRFIDGLVAEGRPLLDIVSADHGHVNDVLAKLYGVTTPARGSWVKQTFSAGQRGAGFLTQGSFLTTAALSETATPIKRGVMVRVGLLCEPLPSPPTDVPVLEEVKAGQAPSERAHLSSHVTRPACRGCHELIDPIGFGLANYNTIGAYRTKDSLGATIEARGEIPGLAGSAYEGAAQLGAKLRTVPQLGRCITTQYFRHAFARIDTADDACAIEAAADVFTKGGARFEALVEAVVGGDAFRLRRLPIATTGGTK